MYQFVFKTDDNFNYYTLGKNLRFYGFLGAIMHMLFYLINTEVLGLEESLWLRIIMAVFYLVLVTFEHRKWKTWQKRFYDMTLVVTLPLFFGYMMIINEVNTYWAISFLFAVFVFGSFGYARIVLATILFMPFFMSWILESNGQVPEAVVPTLIGVYLIGVLSLLIIFAIKNRFVEKVYQNRRLRSSISNQNELLTSLIYISGELAMYDAIETVFEVLVDRFSALMPHYSVGLYLSKGESNRVMRSQLHGVSDEDLAYIKKNYNHLTHMENTTSLEDEFQLPKDWHVFNKKYSIINHSGDVNYNLMMLLIGEQIEAYHVGFIQIFMEQVSGNIRMREQTKQLDLFAKTDQLTQLYNRNAYKQEMDDIVRKYQKEHPYSLVFGDVNGLKRINDTYGHTDGDLLLKICSEVIRKTIPVYRKVFRFGGDEVVILLEDTTLEEAQSIEQELKVAFAEKRMLCTNEVTGEQVYERVSMSFGSVSSFEGTPDELIDLADARMRRMKDAYYLENGIQKYR